MTSNMWMQEGGDTRKKGGTCSVQYVDVILFFLAKLM